MATSSTITIAYSVVLSLGDKFLQYGGIPGVFSGGGLVSALLSLGWPAAAISLPQLAVLVSLFLLTAQNGNGWIGELAGARRTPGF
jgi:hypothetical protein